MQLKAEQLAKHLQDQCLPVYLLTGDEPLLLQECADLVRSAARAAGCTEREVLDTAPKDFSWEALLHSAAELSLFGERKVIELRLPDGKPGAEGSKALCAYLEQASGDDVLLVISGKIDRQSQNSKWFKALDKVGAVVQVWPVTARDMPRWLRQRLGQAGLGIDEDALELLAERLEGNLYAAVQEVEKLKLLAGGDNVTLQTVTTAVLDNARYNLFTMVDTALAGKPEATLRMLHGLRAEGTDVVPLLWAVAREIRSSRSRHASRWAPCSTVTGSGRAAKLPSPAPCDATAVALWALCCRMHCRSMAASRAMPTVTPGIAWTASC